tara:strand:- start:6526 stop:6729 length:204 start_codon:yes stop_codon:yes gene_type:complete
MEKSGFQDIVAWLPESFAKFHAYIQLHLSGAWDNGWLVSSVGKNRLSDKEMLIIRDQGRDARIITDI